MFVRLMFWKEKLSVVTLLLLLSFMSLVNATTCGENQTLALVNGYDYGGQYCHGTREQLTLQPISNMTNVLCYEEERYSENCTKHCNGSECNGDLNFCSMRGCNINSECYCKMQSLKVVLKADCGSGWFTALDKKPIEVCMDASSSYMASDASFVLKEDLFQSVVSNRILKLSLKALPRIKGIIVNKMKKFDLSSLYYEISTEYIKLGAVKKRASTSEVEISLSVEDQSVILDLSDGPLVVYQKSVSDAPNVTADDFCEIGHCDFCNSMPEWSACKARNFGYAKIAVIVLSIIIALFLLPWLVACCSLASKCLKCFCFAPCKIACCFKKVAQEDEVELVATISPTETELQTDIVLPSVNYENAIDDPRLRVTTKSTPRNQFSMPVLCILLLTFGIQNVFTQCTTNVVSNSVVQNCQRANSTHMVCTTRPTFTVALGGIGSTSCIGLTANDTLPAGEIRIKFLGLVARQSLNLAYYTGGFYGVAESSKSCFLTSCCTYDPDIGSCEEWATTGPIQNPCNKFSSYIMNLPGTTRCDSGCCCAGAGCFSCAPYCGYSRAALQPVGTNIKLFSPSLVTYEASIQIELRINGVVTISSLTTSEPFTSTVDFNANLQGVFIDFGINWGGKMMALYMGNNVMRFVDASVPNIPRRDAIGDIQSNTNEGLTNPFPGSFKFDPSIISAYPQTESTVYGFASPGADYLWNYPTLPTTMTGFLWSYDTNRPNEIRSSINRALNSFITITMKKDVSVYYLDDLVCPDFTVGSISGCHSCPTAGLVPIRFRSSCQPGTCTVSAGNNVTLLNTTINLTNAMQEDYIGFISGQRQVDFNLKVTCKEQIHFALVQGELMDPAPLYNNTPDGYVVPPNTGSPLDFGGLFGLPKVAGDVVLAVIIIIGAIVVVVIVIAVVNAVRKRKGLDSSFLQTAAILSGISTIKANAKGYSQLPNTDVEPELK